MDARDWWPCATPLMIEQQELQRPAASLSGLCKLVKYYVLASPSDSWVAEVGNPADVGILHCVHCPNSHADQSFVGLALYVQSSRFLEKMYTP